MTERIEVGLIALLGFLVGAGVTYLYNISLEQRKTQKEKANLAKLLLADIETLWNRYYQVLGKSIEEHADSLNPLFLIFYANQNYFIVFDANAAKIGMFEGEVAAKIVKLYTLAKALIDGINEYEKMCDNYIELQKHPETDIESLNIDDKSKRILSTMQYSFPIIQAEHNNVKVLVSEVKEILESISKK